jgi:hypothetical protein
MSETVPFIFPGHEIDSTTGNISLLCQGIHAYLLIQTWEVSDTGVPARGFYRIEFCPDRFIDRLVGRGVCMNEEIQVN